MLRQLCHNKRAQDLERTFSLPDKDAARYRGRLLTLAGVLVHLSESD